MSSFSREKLSALLQAYVNHKDENVLLDYIEAILAEGADEDVTRVLAEVTEE